MANIFVIWNNYFCLINLHFLFKIERHTPVHNNDKMAKLLRNVMVTLQTLKNKMIVACSEHLHSHVIFTSGNSIVSKVTWRQMIVLMTITDLLLIWFNDNCLANSNNSVKAACWGIMFITFMFSKFKRLHVMLRNCT